MLRAPFFSPSRSHALSFVFIIFSFVWHFLHGSIGVRTDDQKKESFYFFSIHSIHIRRGHSPIDMQRTTNIITNSDIFESLFKLLLSTISTHACRSTKGKCDRENKKKVEDKLHLLEIDQQFLHRRNELSTSLTANVPATSPSRIRCKCSMRCGAFKHQLPWRYWQSWYWVRSHTIYSDVADNLWYGEYAVVEQQHAAIHGAGWPPANRNTFPSFAHDKFPPVSTFDSSDWIFAFSLIRIRCRSFRKRWADKYFKN